jgi:hypothetical protein
MGVLSVHDVAASAAPPVRSVEAAENDELTVIISAQTRKMNKAKGQTC